MVRSAITWRDYDRKLRATGHAKLANRMLKAFGLELDEQTPTEKRNLRELLLRHHRLLRGLSEKAVHLAVDLAVGHNNIRIYRDRHGILLSREAMHTPEHREAFYLEHDERNKED